MNRWIVAALAFVSSHTVNAQDCQLRLSGHVEDTDTREKLVGATVAIVELNWLQETDSTGDFVFNGLCAGNYTVRISHVHCQTVQQKILLNKKRHFDFLLPHAKNTLSEVVVEARKETVSAGFRQELSGLALEEAKALSLSEALSRINGVTMLQTGSTISKPVIHGLHSNRILTINNGVRQEGQQWGNEHAPEIDPFIADKLVVIKGVDELRYGSDAIGGVILVEPKPLRSTPGYSAAINAAWFTNNKQYVASAVFEQQLKKHPSFTYRLQGTFKKGANATTPGYRLNNTGSEEKNFSITGRWKKQAFNTELFYSQFATKVGIFTGSHIGNLTDLQNAIEAHKPDDAFLGQNTYTIKRPYQDVAHRLVKLKSSLYKGEHKFNILLAGQFNHRKEFDIVRSSSNKNPQLDLSITTFSQDLSWEHPRKNNFSGIIGISAMQQYNSYGGRYFIPNYNSLTWGGYVIEKWNKHRWELQAGFRYDIKDIHTTRLKFNGDTINYDFHFSTMASSLQAIYKIHNAWKLNAGISLSSRAPHVNELLSDGIHHGSATYEKGDIMLRPEHAVNLSAGISYQNISKTVGIDIHVYSNHIRNFIYQQPRPDSAVLTIAGAFPLIAYEQTNALLSGADISFSYKPFPALEWISKASVLYARNKEKDDWLILMPANRFSNELTYTFPKCERFSNSYISAEMMNVLRQTRAPSEKNGKPDYKEPPAGYTLIHCNASTTVTMHKMPVTIGIGVRNIFNTKYRDYLNSMRYFTNEMGRNISIRLQIPIERIYQH